jgi:hypothetical protein
VALASALLVAIGGDWPTLSGVLLVASMALATQLAPVHGQRMRGPGNWQTLADPQAFRVERERLPGRFLDTGSLPGFFVFLALLGSFVAVSLALLETQPYHALLALLGGACLLPVFCTGRASELPPDPVDRPRRFFASLARQLRKKDGLTVSALARYPLGQAEPDELRLLVASANMPAGFLAIEVGLEYQAGTGGVVDLPCVIVRVQDDSIAYFALPRTVVWTRGRTPDERVTVLRPQLPTRAQCNALILELVERFRSRPVSTQPSDSRTRLRSSGNGARAVKRSMPVSSQAM